jgi:hypothetical protein
MDDFVREDLDEDIPAEARRHLQEAATAEARWREDAKEDLMFRTGDQWPEKILRDREVAGQPSLTFNLIPKFIRQITGDARQNKPAIDVHPVDSKSDKLTARVIKGITRHIEYNSKADATYIEGLEQSTLTGQGYWQVTTRYVDDESFDQDIVIEPIHNPLSVYFDPLSKKPTREDAMWAMVREWINKDVYKQLYGNKVKPQKDALDAVNDANKDMEWFSDDAVAVANYYKKEPKKYTLNHWSYPTVDGEKADIVLKEEEPEPVGATLVKSREVEAFEVYCYKITGYEIIEKTKIPGKYIPIIPVNGEVINLEGMSYRHGIVRFMKDPQRFWNYWLTMATEQVALAPKAPWLVTPEMIEGFQNEWDNAGSANYPYLKFRPDPAAPGASPRRESPPQLSPAYPVLLQIAQNGLNDTTGIYKPALGQESNETSGRAILARQREGDTGSYVYIDNWVSAIEFTGVVILSMIPEVYDTARIVRIVGDDDEISMVPINQLINVEGVNHLYDLTVGRYDVRISTGPSYTTKRIETANSMLEFVRIYPAAAPLLGDLIAKNMDWPDADEVAGRLAQAAGMQSQGSAPGPTGGPGQGPIIPGGAPITQPGPPIA